MIRLKNAVKNSALYKKAIALLDRGRDCKKIEIKTDYQTLLFGFNTVVVISEQDADSNLSAATEISRVVWRDSFVSIHGIEQVVVGS